MPRPTLGQEGPRGESRVWKLRVSEQEDAAARQAVAEEETLSDLIRLAVSREVARRQRATARRR